MGKDHVWQHKQNIPTSEGDHAWQHKQNIYMPGTNDSMREIMHGKNIPTCLEPVREIMLMFLPLFEVKCPQLLLSINDRIRESPSMSLAKGTISLCLD